MCRARSLQEVGQKEGRRSKQESGPQQSPEWAPWEEMCVKGHRQGESETNQHIADGPSQVTKNDL